MSTPTRTQLRYDHRLKELVRTTGKIDIALESGVPRSTAFGWLTQARMDIVTIDVLQSNVTGLQREVLLLRRRNARLIALLRLIVTVLKAASFSLTRVRLPEERAKLRVLQAIELARVHSPLRTVLRLIRLTPGPPRTDPSASRKERVLSDLGSVKAALTRACSLPDVGSNFGPCR